MASWIRRLFCFASKGENLPSDPRSLASGEGTGADLPTNPPPFLSENTPLRNETGSPSSIPLPQPMFCGNHTRSATSSCTCGLDTLRYGGLDFLEITKNFVVLSRDEESQIDFFGNDIEIPADSGQQKDDHIGLARIFSYDELRQATNNFSRKIGDGGFGNVYLGELKDGQMVAVKELLDNSPLRMSPFMLEVYLTSNLIHQNIIRLIGCTRPTSQELLMVYEYMPNGTLADHLHKAHSQALTWHLRIQIAIETAEALTFLHTSQVDNKPLVHCDIKSDNILLDAEFHVKVADFGLSNYDTENSHKDYRTRAVNGTQGYLDPELEESGKLTDKSDVYSFGVLLVELISGEKVVDIYRVGIYLVDMALSKLQNEEVDQLVDEKLGYHSDPLIRNMIDLVARLALKCLHPEGEMRPSMKLVLKVLKWIKNEMQEIEELDQALENIDVAHQQENDITDPSNYNEEVERLVRMARLNLKDAGNYDGIKWACDLYLGRVSSIIFFWTFKFHMEYATNVDPSCECRLYLQDNRILEGISQSPCFSDFIFGYIINQAAMTYTPSGVVWRLFNRVF